jgi:hypothetical protein
LTIQKIATSSVRLLWQTNDPAYTLQSNTNLSTTNWIATSPLPSISGTNYAVTNSISGTQKHYRLFKP